MRELRFLIRNYRYINKIPGHFIPARDTQLRSPEIDEFYATLDLVQAIRDVCAWFRINAERSKAMALLEQYQQGFQDQWTSNIHASIHSGRPFRRSALALLRATLDLDTATYAQKTEGVVAPQLLNRFIEEK